MMLIVRSRVLMCLALVLALVTTAATAQVPGETPQKQLPKLEFEKYVLPNGLQVILHLDKKLPVVHVNQWFHVGSKNEKRGRTGFAHLFEHFFFNGSGNRAGGFRCR